MNAVKQIFKTATYPELSEPATIAVLFGRYSAEKQTRKALAEHFEAFIIPSAYAEAVQFFLDKQVMSADEFEELEKEMRKKAFFIGQLEDKAIAEGVKASLYAHLASGLNLREWVDGVEAVFDSIGVTGLAPHYLEMVYRNALSEALSEGKRAVFDEADADEFPYMQRIEVIDGRTRKEHIPLNGFIAPKDDPIWQKLRGPLSYNCRGTERLVHKEEGLKPSNWRPSLSGRGFEFVN